MPMADWIHRYPAVAALLQHDGDVLEHASVEDETNGTSDVLFGVIVPAEAWIADVLREAYQIQTRFERALNLYVYVAPDIYDTLLRAAGPCRLSDLALSPALSGQGWTLSLHDIHIEPSDACSLGTWVMHWSEDVDHPRVARTTARAVAWSHVQWPGIESSFEADDDLVPVVRYTCCTAVRPALVCPCGGYVIEWVD